MHTGLVDKDHVRLMESLLSDPKIAESVLVDINKHETYKNSYINEDGSLVLGKRSLRWWNRLFGLEKTISFKDFAFNAFRALVGMADNMNRNTVLRGLSQEIIASAVLDRKYNEIVDRLYDVARYGVKSVLNTTATPWNGEVTEEMRNTDVRKNIKVVVADHGYVPVRDSVGNVLLHLRVKFDGYTFDNI